MSEFNMNPQKFIVLYTTDRGNKSFVEFDSWEEAYKWCQEAIESGTSECDIHWVNKIDSYRVRHIRKMVDAK